MIGDAEANTRIEELLKVTIGLDGSTVGSSLIHRAANRRMRIRGITHLEGYADLIAHDARELQELVEEVVVAETYFFREREALFALAALVQRQALVPEGNEPLRVLSAPCSTGEEPYSIAITLLAAGLPAERIAIDGVDVSHRAVQMARRASYRRNSFRGETDHWAHFFFVETADGLEPINRVRSLVRIEEANILSPTFRAPHDRYDAIFCRNLLIYFDLDAQQRLIGALVRHLTPGGVLFVGAADTFAVRRAGFIALGRDLSFAYQLPSASALVAERPEEHPAAGIARSGTRSRRSNGSLPSPRASHNDRFPVAPKSKATRNLILRDSASRNAAPVAPSPGPAPIDEIASLANSWAASRMLCGWAWPPSPTTTTRRLSWRSWGRSPPPSATARVRNGITGAPCISSRAMKTACCIWRRSSTAEATAPAGTDSARARGAVARTPGLRQSTDDGTRRRRRSRGNAGTKDGASSGCAAHG